MTDIEENLFNETWKTFNNAVDKGVELSLYNPEEEFINQLKTNNAVFAAFRTHRMQNDIAAKLLDDKGNLKPFSQFAKDVLPITNHHVKSWLRTEYDTAVIRAHQAADWKQYEAEKDVLPNLEWLPSTSIVPGEDHKIFWGVVYPVNASFWNSHKPGDRWNCKCRLQATDKATNVAHKNGRDLRYAPALGLDNNPAKDGMIFSKSHPFFTKTYPGAKKAVDKYMAENVSKKEFTISFNPIKEETKKAYKWIENNIVENGYSLPAVKSNKTDTFHLKVTRGALKDVVDHFKTANDKLLIIDVVKQLPLRKNPIPGELGKYKKGDPEKIKKNLDKKKKRGVVSYNYYDIIINKKQYLLNCEVFKGGYEKPYAVTKQRKKSK